MIDWYIIACNISAQMPMERASAACGMKRDWLRNIRRQSQAEPGFNAGMKLLQLHLRTCGKDQHKAAIKRRAK